MALFLRPVPAIPTGFTDYPELLEIGGELFPGLFEEADVLNSRIQLPIDAGTDFGHFLGMPRDAYCVDVPLWVTEFDNGMLEIRPSGGVDPSDVGNLQDFETGESIDSIIHLPQKGETMCVIANNREQTGLVIAGLITLREDTSLYLPHLIAPLYINQTQA